jgi:hypothetical protein
MQAVVRSRHVANRFRWKGLLVGGLVGTMCFLLGRASAPQASAGGNPAVPQVDDSTGLEGAGTRPRALRPPKLLIPDKTETCSGTTDQDRKDTVTFVMNRLFHRIEGLGRLSGLESAEMRANMAREYARGLADAIRMGRSDLYQALTQDFNDRLCNQTMPEDKTILLSYFATELPEIVDNKGLECFFGRAKGKEDASLWYMMDAWRNTGGEKPTALAAIEATATDQRTIRRFMSPEQEEAARSAEATGASGTVTRPLPTPAPTPSPQLPSGQAASPN